MPIFIIAFFLSFLLSFLTGYCGRKRRIGFWGFFIMSLLISFVAPVIAPIVILSIIFFTAAPAPNGDKK